MFPRTGPADILGALFTLLLIAFFVIVVFLIIRQLVLWYWRINEIANNIAYIANYYRKLEQDAARQNALPPQSTVAEVGAARPSQTAGPR